jgi:hypothetical protein
VSAKKRQDDGGDLALANPRASRGPSPLMVMAPIIIALVGGTAYLAWREVGPHVLASGQYQVEPDQIRVTPPAPPWIHGDVKQDVLRDARLDGPLSLVDRDLTVRIAAAFAAHPWVAKVERVAKQYPSGLDVALVYRKPAAMVEVQEGAGGLPVDGDGVLLPTKDFTPDDAQKYPRIGEIHSSPSGPLGTSWGDPSVVGAAQVAAALADYWKDLDLYRIVPDERKPGRTGVEYTFALLTHSGTKVKWGRAPTTHVRGELPAAEKISQLKRYAETNKGSLDDPDGQPHVIVISPAGALLSNPRPRVESLPE